MGEKLSPVGQNVSDQGGSEPKRPRPVASSIALITALVLTLAVPLAAPTLNALSLAGVPVGYWISAQAGLVLVGVLGIWLSGAWADSSISTRLLAFRAAVPAVASWLTAGLSLTVVGALFVMGFDGVPLLLGLAVGLFLALVVVAPALDRAGACHIDELLGLLSGNKWAGAVAGLAIAAGLAILISVELEVAALSARAAGWHGTVLPPEAQTALLILAAAALSLISFRHAWAWALTLSFICLCAVLIGLVALLAEHPAGAVPYLSLAGSLAELTATERELLLSGLADPVSMPPFARPFVQVSEWNFVFLTLSVAIGAAALPHMLWRRNPRQAEQVAPAWPMDGAVGRHSYPTRQKAAFGLVLAALLLACLPATAVLGKLELYRSVAGEVRLSSAPSWLTSAADAGFLVACGSDADDGAKSSGPSDVDASAGAAGCGRGQPLRISDLALNPAGVVLMLPHMANLPEPWPRAMAAALSIIALLAAAATLRMAAESGLGWSIAAGGLPPARAVPKGLKIFATVLVAAACWGLLEALDESPVNRVYWAFALFGASLSPMLLLCALAPRISGTALAFGGLVGLSIALYYMIGTTSVFAPQFALFWSQISDAPPWLLEDLQALLATCEAAGPAPSGDALAACADAVTLGRELANWFGLDSRAAAAIAAPVAIAGALVAAVVLAPFRRTVD